MSADHAAAGRGETPPTTEEVARALDVDAARLEAFVDREARPTAAAVLGFAVADASNRRLVGRWLTARLGGDSE
jgi:hypothetical protein